MPNFATDMTQSGAKLTIVVPVYNRAKLVERTLQSIARQTLRPLDVVLVDNNSSDNTLSVLQQWAREHSTPDFEVKVTTESTPGAAAARNKGLSLVTTPYVMFFDSDDTMQPTLCQDYVDAFSANGNPDLVYTGAWFNHLDGSRRRAKMCQRNLLHGHIYHAILRTVGYAANTEWFRNTGAWDINLLGWDDWELGIRLLLNNPRVAYLEGAKVDIFVQEQSISGTDFASRPRLWEDAIDKADSLIAQSGRKDADTLHRLLDYRRIVLAAHYAKEGANAEAKRLYDSVMKEKHQNWRMRLLMPMAYSYIKRGGRGAASLLDLIL